MHRRKTNNTNSSYSIANQTFVVSFTLCLFGAPCTSVPPNFLSDRLKKPTKAKEKYNRKRKMVCAFVVWASTSFETWIVVLEQLVGILLHSRVLCCVMYCVFDHEWQMQSINHRCEYLSRYSKWKYQQQEENSFCFLSIVVFSSV